MRSFLGNAIMEKENKKKGQVMNIINKLSVVISVYNEEAVLDKMYQAVVPVVESLPCEYELLFVNDGSKDASPAILDRLAMESEKVKVIHFSRNYGHEAAMIAGIDYSTGDGVICMDADLQHPPALVPEMIKQIEAGYDCCAALRTSRKGESKIKSFFSGMFYKFSNRFTDVQLVQNAVDFRIMSRQMVDNIVKLSEVQRFSKGIFEWVGFETSWIPYENVERIAGETKWSFKSLFKYAITGITSFSITPLRFLTCFGLVISVVAFLLIVFTLIRKLAFGIDVSGYASLLIAVLFLGGIIELSLGILGEYIAKRQTYIHYSGYKY